MAGQSLHSFPELPVCYTIVMQIPKLLKNYSIISCEYRSFWLPHEALKEESYSLRVHSVWHRKSSESQVREERGVIKYHYLDNESACKL